MNLTAKVFCQSSDKLYRRLVVSNIISFDDAKRRRTGQGTKTLQVNQSTGKVTPKDKELQKEFEDRIYRI